MDSPKIKERDFTESVKFLFKKDKELAGVFASCFKGGKKCQSKK